MKMNDLQLQKSIRIKFLKIILSSHRRMHRYDSNSVIQSELINILCEDMKMSCNNSEGKPGNKIQLSDSFWKICCVM